MKIKVNEASQKIGALNLIPLKSLTQATRVKVVRASIEYEKALEGYRKECDEGLKKLKPEGFDERAQKYAAALNPTADNREQAEKQRAEAGFDEFKAEFDKVDADHRELVKKIAEDVTYDANPPAFTDADFEDIAASLPSGATTQLTRDGETVEVSNDQILGHIIATLA